MREENQIREKGGGNRIKIHGRIYTPASNFNNLSYKTISGISAFQNFSMLLGPPDTVLLLEVVLRNVCEL